MIWQRSRFITVDPPQKQPHPTAAGPSGDIFATKSRTAWGHGTQPEPRCDFSPSRVTLTPISGGARVATLWRRSAYGQTLSEIKSSGNMLSFMAPKISAFIRSIIGPAPDPESYIIVSPPKRRHPGSRNFASRLCGLVAQDLSLTYIDDFATCRTRARINPEFTIAVPIPRQPSIIVIDDILTTGSTLTAMHSLITEAHRSPILIAAILNRK